MADLLPKERLQPSLLDRLIDSNPKRKGKPPEKSSGVSADSAPGLPETSFCSEDAERSGGISESEDDRDGSPSTQKTQPPGLASGEGQEKPESYFWSVSKLRQSVIRDLEWLLNTGNLEMSEDLSAYPYAASSVINYGIPNLVGGSLSSLDRSQLERRIREAIWNFEPRILKKSLRVHIHSKDRSQTRNALSMEIEGEVWSQPVPLHLFLQAEVNVETGKVNLSQTATPRSD